jgi:3-oxoacyl-[acyl-carrier-protein] synthase II
VLAEGAGVLVLETIEHALRRGVSILAEVAGIGMSCDAYHITSAHPDGRGASQAMTQALESAGMKPNDIDYINAHGTSTQINDQVETLAIKNSFGDCARSIPISSIKSMIGHSVGAAGALEAITCVNVISQGVIPPTINQEILDPQCDLDYVPNRARPKAVRVAMSNSFAFGGQNCVLVFKRFDS